MPASGEPEDWEEYVLSGLAILLLVAIAICLYWGLTG